MASSLHSPTRTVVMTGASRGIGRVAAQHLLRGRPDLHLVILVRGTDGERLAAELSDDSGNPHITSLRCDLAAFADIRESAQSIRAALDHGDLPPLRGFLGNAGVVLPSARRATADDFEMTFGVNVLANYLLLRLLFDRFTSPARLVITTSEGHFGDFAHTWGTTPPPRWEDVERLASPATGRGSGSTSAGARAYATSKLGVIYLVHALARRLPPGIDVYSYTPGPVTDTGLLRHAGPTVRTLVDIMLRLRRATGSATGPDAAGELLAAAVEGVRPSPTGAYLDRGKDVPSSAESYDVTREEALWHDAARLCGLPAEPEPTMTRP
ncbi:SDR family NAD(P)-dependent oxidoreductase [Streptomyces sp. 2A115]|uniref:SDR family NAD(P)-dependent oxidoreductase n=1 Tax=Streptomyces sp. 2A115 TaxID=3457439 RepID=UPI003FD568D7